MFQMMKMRHMMLCWTTNNGIIHQKPLLQTIFISQLPITDDGPGCILDSDSKEVVPDSEPEEQPVEGKDNELQSNASEEPTEKCLKQCDAKPTQLQFYPAKWVDVLKQAKQFFWLWMIKECPFP